MEQSLSLSMGLHLDHKFPLVAIMGEIASLDDDSLSTLLNECLEDIIAYKSESNGKSNGNFYNTSVFASKVTQTAKKVKNHAPQEPSYSAEILGSNVKLQSLNNFTKSRKALEAYKKKDGPTDSRNIFSKSILGTLNFVDRKRAEAVEYVLMKQHNSIDTGEISKLAKITQGDIGEKIGLHESTVSRLVSGLSFEYNGKEYLLTDLIQGGQYESIRGLKHLLILSREKGFSGHKWEISDQKLMEELESRFGINCARRTVNKYRNKLKDFHIRFGIDKPTQEREYIEHWSFERPIQETEIVQIINGNLDTDDQKTLNFFRIDSVGNKYVATPKQISIADINNAHPAQLYHLYSHNNLNLVPEVQTRLYERINEVGEKCNSFNISDLDFFISKRDKIKQGQ